MIRVMNKRIQKNKAKYEYMVYEMTDLYDKMKLLLNNFIRLSQN